MPSEDRYYEKFYVERYDDRDQPGGDRYGARYLTLDITHDPLARAAAVYYADLAESNLPNFARELRKAIAEEVA